MFEQKRMHTYKKRCKARNKQPNKWVVKGKKT